FFHCYSAPRDPHSFPTRRSSDLKGASPHDSFSRRPAYKNIWNTKLGYHALLTNQVVVESQFALTTLIGDNFLYLIFIVYSFIALDRKSTRLNSSHVKISYAVFCL